MAMVRATRLSCEPGTPVTRSTSSGVHLATSALIWSMPQTRWRMNSLSSQPFSKMCQRMPQIRADVGARTEAHILVGVGRGAREARVADDQRRVVLLLGLQHVLQRHRMRFGRVAADEEHRARVVDVVVAVGHRAVAPGVGNTRDRGRVTDPRLVVAVVGAPEGVELAEQIGLLVVVLGRAEPVHRVRTVPGDLGPLLADLQHLVADLVDVALDSARLRGGRGNGCRTGTNAGLLEEVPTTERGLFLSAQRFTLPSRVVTLVTWVDADA